MRMRIMARKQPAHQQLRARRKLHPFSPRIKLAVIRSSLDDWSPIEFAAFLKHGPDKATEPTATERGELFGAVSKFKLSAKEKKEEKDARKAASKSSRNRKEKKAVRARRAGAGVHKIAKQQGFKAQLFAWDRQVDRYKRAYEDESDEELAKVIKKKYKVMLMTPPPEAPIDTESEPESDNE